MLASANCKLFFLRIAELLSALVAYGILMLATCLVEVLDFVEQLVALRLEALGRLFGCMLKRF